MKLSLIILTSLLAAVFSRTIVKRNNSYGDEPNAPVAQAAAPIPAEAPSEQAPSQAQQEAAPVEGAKNTNSGYRKKRNNSYGDEPSAPAAPVAQAAAPIPAPSEQGPSQTYQEAAPVEGARNTQSGYRKKRNNSYGDEPNAPVAPVAQAAAPIPVAAEQGPAQAEQEAAPMEGARNVVSGY